jgi:hypothetical protein
VVLAGSLYRTSGIATHWQDDLLKNLNSSSESPKKANEKRACANAVNSNGDRLDNRVQYVLHCDLNDR